MTSLKIGSRKKVINMNKKKSEKTAHLRITFPRELYNQLEYLSKANGRTLKEQVEYYLVKYVSMFEEKNGVIEYNPKNENEK